MYIYKYICMFAVLFIENIKIAKLNQENSE